VTRAWITLAAMSVIFFLITATTFSSLGVVLPTMIGELHWSWGGAGGGFSLLGVAAGITATIPASMIRRFGVRATLVAGSLVMAAAFACMALTHGLMLYFLGCLLMGLGFTLLATVPGTYLLARLFARPSFAFGLYFTVGAWAAWRARYFISGLPRWRRIGAPIGWCRW
jgi:MFS transporter, OFA family, oxalate/formate antiporter